MHISPRLPTLQPQTNATRPADTGPLHSDARQTLGQNLHARQQQRLQDMQSSQVKLQQIKKNSSPKKAASQKAALLKQRLDTLKTILQRLPPGDYKTMVQEIKQIAKELAALGRQLGQSGGSNLPAALQGAQFNLPEAATAQTATADSTLTAALAQSSADTVPVTVEPLPADLSPTPTATDAAPADATEPDSPATPDDTPAGLSASGLRLPGQQARQDEDEDDKALRATLNESKKLLKEILNLLKSKHQSNDKESRQLINAIERELNTLERTLDTSAIGLADSSPGTLINTIA